jgi:hypothetical protein
MDDPQSVEGNAGEYSQPAQEENMQFGPGFAGVVTAGNNLNFERAGGVIISAGQNMELSFGGGLMINAGGDMDITNGGAWVINTGGNSTIHNGGAWLVNIGGNADVTNGGGVVLAAKQATARNSKIGVLISGQANLEEGSQAKVVLNQKQALFFGAAFGAVFGLLSLIFRRR